MDPQRLVLSAALAVVTYLLILAWNEDYGQPGTIPSPQVTTIEQAPAPQLPQEKTDSDATVVDDTSNGELPTASDAISDTTDVAEEEETIAQVRKLINVETDALLIKIDTRGGDIVQVALKKYPLLINQPDIPFVLMNQNGQLTYVAQSGLIGRNGPDAASSGRPIYSTEKHTYILEDGQDSMTVDLVFKDEQGVNITKRFVLKRDSYTVDLEFIVDNKTQKSWNGRLFAQLKRDNSDDPSHQTSMGMASFLGAATSTEDQRYTKFDFDEFQDSPLKEKHQGGWIAILQHYFISAWIPDKDNYSTYQTRKSNSGDNIAGLVGQSVTVDPGSQGSIKAQFYAGPKIQKRLEAISPGLELTVDYGWLWFIAQPLFWLLDKFNSLLGNWGWAIIATTFVIKLLFFHLSAASYRSMANMRRVSPELQRLKSLHGDDKQKMSQAMMELYKKEKINPLGGCLPILVQMPVFIALYWVLLESVELRHAPFIFWIEDLSVKDPYFILPILMGVSMYIQQMLNPEPPDPMQARIMKLMPVMFTFFFLWFPSGLVVYWLVNNILSIAQQYVITRRIENAAKASSS